MNVLISLSFFGTEIKMSLVLEIKVLSIKLQLERSRSKFLGECSLAETVQVRSERTHVHLWIGFLDLSLVHLNAWLADEERDSLLLLLKLVVNLSNNNSSILLESVWQEWHLNSLLDLI